MLTEVKAYSSWVSAPTLLLDEDGRPETDLIQVRKIVGLDPVKADVNTSQFGSVDGASYTGGNVATRNIVLTLKPNPDWHTWTYEKLRSLIYSYFMPKRPTRLVFYSSSLPPVEIWGIVESVTVDIFSKEPEMQVSIICPDPYFTALEATVITGSTVRDISGSVTIPYNGTIETGVVVDVTWVANPAPTKIDVQVGNPALTFFHVDASVNSAMFFETSSVQMNKYVQNVSIGTGVITNLLSKSNIDEGSAWPIFQPGDNEFAVITDQGTQDWQLTFYERFGGL